MAAMLGAACALTLAPVALGAQRFGGDHAPISRQLDAPETPPAPAGEPEAPRGKLAGMGDLISADLLNALGVGGGLLVALATLIWNQGKNLRR